MIDMNAIIEFEDIVLMKKRISQRLNLSPEQFRLSWRRDTIEFIEDHFVFELDVFLYGKELGTTAVLEVETYETWFDHRAGAYSHRDDHSVGMLDCARPAPRRLFIHGHYTPDRCHALLCSQSPRRRSGGSR